MKPFCTLIIALFTLGACAQKQNKVYYSPRGYDLNKPEVIKLPTVLAEISGITFHPENPNVLFAEQDEEGIVYAIKPNGKMISESKFGKGGDYEDLTIVANTFVVLRSDGTLFTFPYAAVPDQEFEDIQTWKDLIPQEEYEALAVDQEQLYIVCKQCDIDKKKDRTSGYTLKIASDGALLKTGEFTIDSKQIDKLVSLKGKAFRPSALTKNQLTNEWFILSSINKLLIITDTNWQVKEAFKLNPKLFNQPEGIAFDKNHHLYISNEAGSKHGQATLLKFKYTH